MADSTEPFEVPDCDEHDEQLVGRVARGDLDALGALYDRYKALAFGLARAIGGDPGFAEDVVQEAFATVWTRPHRYDPERGPFSSWLLTVVHHEAVSKVRHEPARWRRASPAEASDDRPSRTDLQGDAIHTAQVRDALQLLPAEQRETVALAYFSGHTVTEIAQLTGEPVGTVTSRMFTGVRRLRDALAPLTGGPGGVS